jgi:TatD DNase family protein
MAVLECLTLYANAWGKLRINVMNLVDTHAHINNHRLSSMIDDVLARSVEAGVNHIVAIGTNLATSQECVQLAEQHAMVSAAVGIQPNCCAEAKPEDWDLVADMFHHPQVKAIGETGLDRYWDDTPFEMQEDYFDRHLRASQMTGLPFVVHMRECGDDVLRMLTEAHDRGPLRGVMHSFTGDLPLMRACVELGLYISFAGMVTYKNADDLREVASFVPAERLLIETDSPYLSPHPKRAQRPNEPSLIVHTISCLADVRGVAIDELAETTTANAEKLFGLRK